jgi:preprotein translocase subunit YajC
MSHLFFTLLAQSPTPAAQSPGGLSMNTFIPMICIFVIIYFLMIRPESQRRKQMDSLVKSIKTGDRVITSSGIHGMVSNVKETTVIVKIADNVKIELEKSSVGTVLKTKDEPESAPAS